MGNGVQKSGRKVMGCEVGGGGQWWNADRRVVIRIVKKTFRKKF